LFHAKPKKAKAQGFYLTERIKQQAVFFLGVMVCISLRLAVKVS